MSTVEELKSIARKAFEVLAAPTDSKIEATFDAHVVFHEHGPQTTDLPFLGRDFKGFEGIKQYLEVLLDTLDIIQMEWAEWVAEQKPAGLGGVVFTKGLGTFAVKRTKKHWNETFIAQIEVNEEGKVVRYDVFAVSNLSLHVMKRF
jgi:hypothetical protein